MRFFLYVLLFAALPHHAYAQFDFLGAAEKLLTASRPILTQGNTANQNTNASSATSMDALPASLNATDLQDALRQALSLSAVKVTNQLGTVDGFYGDPKIKIPLPDQLQTAHAMLNKVGFGSLGNELEMKINRAAEMAMPQARDLFVSSIKQMTLKDAQNIMTGPDDAATQFFQSTMGDDLVAAIRPIINDELQQVRGMQTYNQLVQQYANIPFAPAVNTDLSDYVANMAMDGIFTYMAREEAAIRANPVERTTSLLQKVFSAYQ